MHAAPRYVRFRVARPARDLTRSTAFYYELLGLPHTGGFRDHDGYDGNFFALPDGGELELTTGPIEPSTPSEEDLLVLYLNDLDAVQTHIALLVGAGVETVTAANPYWERWGRTVLDPDGHRVVIAAQSLDTGSVEIEWHDGAREALRPLFELAEDSQELLDEYLGQGRVLVARRGAELLGHLQLTPTEHQGDIELKNMAVVPEARGTGIGRALIEAALQRSRADGRTRMLVATAAASVGNLRFYQRLGFRMSSVDRDVFTPETGYPEPIMIDGVPLRDRVWLAQEL
ncbi:MAG TPA: GNAT family N-acetyltransferase [Jatrophihabitans sp.]|jgi:GNAT superfamily N-acetyltransferase|nr:GNAT family N-acetyltransferase [Jatrophihabitans sp.]